MGHLIATMVLIATAAFVTAQEATNVDLEGKPTEEKVPLAPTPEPSVPDLSQIDEIFRQTSLGKEADQRRLHLEWRQLANRVANDSEIIAAKKSAEAARTDLEKRERLRAYYNIYYGKMRGLASSAQMKTALDVAKNEHLSHINQPHVRHSTDEFLSTPTPEPKHKRRKKK